MSTIKWRWKYIAVSLLRGRGIISNTIPHNTETRSPFFFINRPFMADISLIQIMRSARSTSSLPYGICAEQLLRTCWPAGTCMVQLLLGISYRNTQDLDDVDDLDHDRSDLWNSRCTHHRHNCSANVFLKNTHGKR